ncbi:hypothetical protein PsYK624_005070 [Phanerochaete sordida]|uniref:BTB domain-containing protein n=1 Tax=Phanerochaete sordida TaxID=48140 RepID=A0A9P3L6W3_9APHY|nr:hypothetical protein PsYK624_005070 [Phanerochaete sordida]
MTSSEQPKIASSPFDNPMADLIIRSSDAVDFFVPRVLMALASPVFEGMFIVAEPTSPACAASAHAHAQPVVDLTEDSRTIDRLLRFIYPMARPALASAAEALAVLEAASKYMVDHAVADVLQQFAALAEVQPHAAYLLACDRRREDAVRVAARAALLRRAPAESDAGARELEAQCPGALARLRAYHDACGAAASGVVAGYVPRALKLHTGRGRMSFMLRACALSDEELVEMRKKREWWQDPLKHAASIVRATPHPRVVASPKFWSRVFVKGAQENWDPAQEQAKMTLMEQCRVELSESVEAAISKVRLEVVL